MAEDQMQRGSELEHGLQLAGVRVIMLGWCLWLLGSWAVTLSTTSPSPGARWMIFAALLGLMLVWPMVRLSQGPVRRVRTGKAWEPGRGWGVGEVWTLWFEWLCLNLVFQAVIWPLYLLADWRMSQAWWIALAVAAWSLLSGLIIGLGRRLGDQASKALAMVVCVAVVFAEPLLMWLAKQGEGGPGGPSPAVGGQWQMRVSPLQTLWALTGDGQLFDPDSKIPVVFSVVFAAIVGWVGLGIWVWFTQRSEAKP